MARFLHKVQLLGIKTSIDTIGDSTSDYAKMFLPTFKYYNYVIINEIECCSVWGLEARRADGSINKDNVLDAMRRTVDAEVGDRVVVHAKEYCFIMNTKKEYVESCFIENPHGRNKRKRWRRRCVLCRLPLRYL